LSYSAHVGYNGCKITSILKITRDFYVTSFKHINKDEKVL